jgi:hypothetical protein
MATYTNIHGALRLYDGTATPYYVAMLFDNGDLSAPEGRARTEETVIFHRGRGSADTHYVSGPDTPIVEPMEISYSFRVSNVTATHDKIRAAHSNPDGGAWSVDGDTWVTTKGDYSLINGAGAAFTDPAFEDTLKFCVNVEVLWTRDAVAVGRKYGAVWFPPDQIQIQEAEDGVTVSVTGRIYGLVTPISAFTAGTAS